MTGNTITKDDNSYWGYEDYGLNAVAKINYNGLFEYIIGLDQQKFSGVDDVWRIGKQKEKVNASFFQLRTTQKLFNNTLIALGVRNNKATNMDNSIVWNLTGKHSFNEDLYFQGNLGSSFRMPEALFLNEYYDDDKDGIPDGGWFAIGNPNLEPEKSKNINLSIGGNMHFPGINQAVSYEFIAFKRDITHYIDSYVPIVIAGIEGESFTNSDDEVNVDGFEIMAAVNLIENVKTQFSYTNTRAKFNGHGPQVTSIPKEEAKLKIDYRHPTNAYGVALTMNHVGEVNARRNKKRGNYTVADLSAFYKTGAENGHTFTFRLENLTNKEYITRVDRGTLDASDLSYLFGNLGMKRTLHFSYKYQF